MIMDFYSFRSFPEVREFHCIMPIDNAVSVLKYGILSYKEASKLKHASIALKEVQIRREKKVPNGLVLHKYANLYFHARNPMMFKRKDEDIFVLRIDKSVIELEGIVFTDRNAASDYVRFIGIEQVDTLNFYYIYAADWRDPNTYVYYEKRSKKCAEVLIPKKVPPEYITGAYVKNEKDKKSLQDSGFDREIEVNKEIFFG